MTRKKAEKIANQYWLQIFDCKYNSTIRVHFMNNAGFYLAVTRRKKCCENTAFKLLAETTEKEFHKLCKKIQHHPKTEAERHALQLAIDFRDFVTPHHVQIPGVKYYPEFQVISLMGDGFAQARFVFSKDFTQVYHAFTNKYTLVQNIKQSEIPLVFPIEDFPKWLKYFVI